MKALVASFAAVAMFVGFAVSSNACGKDGKCVGKASTACCANKGAKSAKAGCCANKSATAKNDAKDTKATTSTVKVAETSSSK